ncbi:sorting nexin-15 [Alosa sapidissima]|uniref:sorting nexin-15 n=1 Tax=Alosa sapidissima TaxID=34773 RepID=UPI001C09E06D|nr:sorting nexin-15 [Alosa sapidissima]
MSRKVKEEYYRFFSVTDTRTHEKGHTEYKVMARFVSKRRPEDVKEVVVWRRYSELKKLHGELAYTHRNLFRRQEEFPPFPRAQVFGRFDEAVIQERMKAAEAMLLFTTNIPALYNSPQLKEFFRGGEVTRPLDPPVVSSTDLPPPLIPLPKGSSTLQAEEEQGREAPLLPQELDSDVGSEGDEPEVGLEAYGEMESSSLPPSPPSPAKEVTQTRAESPENNGTEEPPSARDTSPAPPASTTEKPDESQEEFDLLFDTAGEGPVDNAPPPPLSDTDLAIFDPCAKEDQPYGSFDNSELLSTAVANESGKSAGEAGYLAQAANELNAALEKEKEGDYGAAILQYRTAVDILIKGVHGDPDPQRRDSVKRRTAQYLQHAETLLNLHSPTHTPTHTQHQST